MISVSTNLTVNNDCVFDQNNITISGECYGGLICSNFNVNFNTDITNTNIINNNPEAKKDNAYYVYYGGLIYAYDLTFKGNVSDVTITSKFSKVKGGLFYSYRSTTITDSTFDEITIDSYKCEGGLTYINESIEDANITNVTVTNWKASTYNGALIYINSQYNSTDLYTISNLTVSELEFSNVTNAYGIIYGVNINLKDSSITNVTIEGKNLDYSEGILIKADKLVIENLATITGISIDFTEPNNTYSSICGLIYASNLELKSDLVFDNNYINVSNRMYGGFVYLYNNSSDITIDHNIKFTNNTIKNATTGKDYPTYGLFVYYNTSDNQKSIINNIIIEDNDIDLRDSNDNSQTYIYGFVYKKAGTFEIKNMSVKNNTINAEDASGLIVYTEYNLILKNSIIDNNSINLRMNTNGLIYALNYGGGYDSGKIASIDGLTISNNTYNTSSNDSAASFVYLKNAGQNHNVTLKDIIISGNTINSSNDFNAIYLSFYAYVENLKFNSNIITSKTLSSGIIYQSSSDTEEYYCTLGTMMINGLEAKDNTITVDDAIKAGLLRLRMASIKNATITGNEINAGKYIGEQLQLSSNDVDAVLIYAHTLALEDSNIESNTFSSAEGSKNVNGLIYIKTSNNSDPLYLKNTNIKNNSLSGSVQHGIIYINNENEGTATLDNTQISDNQVTSTSTSSLGSGIYIYQEDSITIQIMNKIVVDNNKLNSDENNITVKLYNDSYKFKFEVPTDKTLTNDSSVSVLFNPVIKNNEHYCLVENGKDYQALFSLEDSANYINVVTDDLYINGRVISEPTKENKTYEVYYEDLTGVTATYEWYLTGEENPIEGQNTKTYTSDKYILANVYCKLVLSNGLTYTSKTLSLSPSIIEEPNKENNYKFDVETDNLESANATIAYEWYKKIEIETQSSGATITNIDNTNATEISSGTSVYYNGSDIDMAGGSVYDSETGKWKNTVATSPEYFIVKLNLTKGQLLLINCDAENEYFYLFSGDATDSTATNEIYITNNSVGNSGYYYIQKTGVYTYFSMPYTYGSSYNREIVEANYTISVIDVSTIDFNKAEALAEAYSYEGIEFTSVYNDATNTYSSDASCGVIVSMDQSEAIYLEPVTEPNPSSCFYLLVLYSTDKTNWELLGDEYLLSSSIFIAPTTGYYLLCFYNEGASFEVGISSISLNNKTDYDDEVLYEDGLTVGEGLYASTKDEEGNFILPDALKDSALLLFSVKLSEGYYLLNLASYYDEYEIIIYFDENGISYDYDKLLCDYSSHTYVLNASKEGYYTIFVWVEDPIFNPNCTFSIKEFGASAQYELIDCTDSNLNNVESGTYYAIAKYTQGEKTFSLKSKPFAFESYQVTYITSDTIIGILPEDDHYYTNKFTSKTTDAYKSGYTIIGWSTTENATEVLYDFGVEYDISSNLTLYPVFSAKEDVIITETAQTKTYTCSALSFDISGTTLTGFTVKYYTPGTETEVTPTNAGSYDVKITRDEDSTYKLYSKVISNGLVIAQATGTITVDTTKITKVYGETLTLPVATSNFGSVTCDKSVSDLVNVGTYTVTYTLAGTDNYTSDTKTLEVEIIQDREDVTGITFVDSTVTYDGTSHAIAITGTLPDGVTVTYKCNNEVFENATNAGTYTVVATFTDSTGHYNVPADMTATLTINKATGSITVDTTKITKVYGESLTLPTATSNFGSVTCDKSVSDLVNVGTYTVTYTLEGTDNYTGDTKTLEVEITQDIEDVTGITFEDNAVRYDGLSHTISITGTLPEGVTVTYKCNDEVFENATNAGTYTVVASFTDSTGHYNVPTDMTATLTITKATGTITVDTTKITKVYGESLTLPTATSNFGSVTFDKSVSDLVNANTYTVTYTLEGTDNYTSDTKTLEVEITKATGVITVDTTKITKVYGETLTLPVATSNFGSVTCDKSVSDLVNVGTYTVTYTLAGTDNYTSDTKTLEVEITKATYDMSAISFANASFTYDGNSHSLGVTGTLPNGVTVTYSENNTLTNVGSVTVTATFTGDSNHNAINPMTATLTITKGKANITVDTNTIKVVEGNEVTLPTATTNYGSVTCDTNASDLVNVGTYTVTYTVVGTDNYDGDTKSLSVVIKAKEIKTPTEGDTKPEVKVDATTGFDPNIKVVVDVTVETKVEEKIKANALYNYNNKILDDERVGVVFDVKLKRTVDGVETEIQPSDLDGVTSITVMMKLPSNLDLNVLKKIMHVHGDGSIEIYNFDRSKVTADGYYEITISKLSEFAFIYQAPSMSTNQVIGTILWPLLALILIIYFMGYFLLYREGHLDNLTIRYIYKILPRGRKSKN